MGKTPEKVTKDPKRVEAACKGREKYRNKLKESILNDVKKGSRNTTNASNETTSATNNASNETTSVTSTTISNDTYVYGVGILAVLAIGVCVFLHITILRLKIKNRLRGKTGSTTKMTSYDLKNIQ